MSNNFYVHSLLDTEIRAKAIQLQEDKENNRDIIELITDLSRTMPRQGISFWGTQSDLKVILVNFFPSRQGNEGIVES